MDFSIKFDPVTSGWFIVFFEWSQVKTLKIYKFLSVRIDVFANSADPDEMLNYAAFHLGLHCLQNYLFRVFLSTKV